MDKDKIEAAIAETKGGNLDAFTELVEGTAPVLRTYASFFIQDQTAIDDILQESYLQIYDKLGDYEPGTNFVAWAKTIVRFQALSERRRRERKDTARKRYEEDALCRIAEKALEDEEAHPIEDRMKFLEECLGKLTERTREMMQMRYFQGRPLRDLARSLDMKTSAVGITLHRARLALAECMEKRE